MTPTPEPSWCQPTSTSAGDPGGGGGATPGRTPQERGLSWSAFCSLGWQPLMITGLCRDLLVRHFGDPASIASPDLKSFVWTPTERTGILIETITRWTGTMVGMRPAVIIKQNARRNVRYAIGNRLTGTDERGMQRYETVWIGSHTLFCLHGSGAGADILATEVEQEMTDFGPQLTRSLGLLKWAVTEVGAVQEIEESREGFVAPVTVAWAYSRAWTIDEETPKLKKIAISSLLYGATTNQTL